MLKQILSSFFIGGSIVVGPYTLATQIPTSQVKKAEGEEVGFGDRCLFDEAICALMKETKFEQDQEQQKSDDTEPSESDDIDKKIEKRVNKEWKNFLQPSDEDYCGFGFLTLERDPITGREKDTNINTLEKC